MVDELAVFDDLNKNNEEIAEISKQLKVLKHEFRRTQNDTTKLELKKQWDSLQAKLKPLEKKHRILVEQKNEIDYKNRWKFPKPNETEFMKSLNPIPS